MSRQALVQSTPKLPRELLLMVAEEVGANIVAPGKLNTPIYYDEWFKAIEVIWCLQHTDWFFRVVCAPKLRAWAPWVPDISHFRRTTNPPSWAIWSLAVPLRWNYAVPSPAYRIRVYGPFCKLAIMPKPGIGHMIFSYFVLELFASTCKLSVAMSGMGTHLLPTATPGSLLDALTRFVEGHERAKAVTNSEDEMERFMESWPCDTVRYITIILDDAECAGWSWGISTDMPKHAHDFISGRSLNIPDSGSQSRAAELMVAMFPRLERVNIVRKPLRPEIKDAWLQRRPLFSGLSENTPGMYVYPLIRGGDSTKAIKFTSIPKLLYNLDRDFLCWVHCAIARRKCYRDKAKREKEKREKEKREKEKKEKANRLKKI